MAQSEMAQSEMAHGGGGGIEGEDDMVEVNRLTTTATMHWRFLDTGGSWTGPAGPTARPSTGSSPSVSGSSSGW